MPTDQPVFSGATLNYLIGEAESCRRAANRLRVEPSPIVERHGLTAHAIKGNEQTADELDQLRAIAELMNADPEFASHVRYVLDRAMPCVICGKRIANGYRNVREQWFCWPCADGESPESKADRHEAVADIQYIALAPRPDGRFYREPEGAFEARLAAEIAAEGTYQQRHGGEPVNDDEAPSHLRPDSSSDQAAEDEHLAAGTGPLAGDTRGTES